MKTVLVKIMFMRPKPLFVALSLFFLSCSKSGVQDEKQLSAQQPIFSSQKQAFDKIGQYLARQYPTEKLYTIDNISYIHTDSKTMAIVFYQTNTGEHNMLVERSSTSEESFGGRVTVCEGTQCNCKVTAVIDNQGNVTIDCNCGSCAMISTEL